MSNTPLYKSLGIIALAVMAHWTAPAFAAATTEPAPVDLIEYEDVEQPVPVFQALLHRGEQLLETGHYNESLNYLTSAHRLAEHHQLAEQANLAKGLLGNLYTVLREPAKAQPRLQEAYSASSAANWVTQAADQANYLAIHHSYANRYDSALSYFKESEQWSDQAGQQLMVMQSRLNIAKLYFQKAEQADAGAQDYQHAARQLRNALDQLQAMAADQEAPLTSFWLSAGYLSSQLQQHGIDTARHKKQAFNALSMAARLAKSEGQPRNLSLAKGHLGEMYAGEKRHQEALALFDEAIHFGQQAQANDLLMEWEWQKGRIYKTRGQRELALEAFRHAVRHVETIRQDIPVEYNDGRSSYRATLEPLYLTLAELLIDSASDTRSGQGTDAEDLSRSLFAEAQQTVELIKRTELEDYFNNRCVIEARADVDISSLEAQTAAIYPVILPDKLEIIVSVDGNYEHTSVAVEAEYLKQLATGFAKELRTMGSGYRYFAESLHDYLIKPIQPILDKHNVQTLVFLPDGPLRLVPVSALHGGERFVIEDYAVVTSPGLTLFDPQPIPRGEINTLLAGVSRPGQVVRDLPEPIIAAIINPEGPDPIATEKLVASRDLSSYLARGLKAKGSEPGQAPQPSQLTPDQVLQLQDLLALPGVAAEINQLKTIYPSTVLLNDSFRKADLVEEVTENEFQLVHIASHGIFGETSQDSFVMAHDEVISMDELERLLTSNQFAEQPIEMLTLSACQTAEGDDRAPLGISGIAIRANVSSALGSLWSVSDQATVGLMNRFYTNLKSPELSKAQALQKAQVDFVQNSDLDHPFFWSPFILIGNWL